MADEVRVFFAGKLPSRAAFNKAMRALGHPVSLVDQKGSLEGQRGFMPMRLFREESGVEFDVLEGREEDEELERGVDPSLDRRASFRWSGSLDEAFLGYCGAVAVARLTGGVILDEAEGRMISVDEAIAATSALLEARPPDTPRLGTRPADLKRYLKSLLKMRPDLVLVGRLLFIRPVRHILRGALLDRSGDKYSMTLWRYLKPLYEGPEGLGYGNRIHQSLWYVYEPYFQPLLLDVLREDVFSDLGQLSSMEDLARHPAERYESHGPPIVELVLAGEREHATALVDEIERTKSEDSYWRHWAKTQRAFLSRKIEDVCSEFHAEEARTAKALKLDGLWAPSPFPVEVPKAERVKQTSDPPFGTMPWIETPPWLLGKMPEQPGEVRFAENEFKRGNGTVLLVPLIREAADDRHRTAQNYVLAARLANGDLVVLRHYTGWSPHNPVQPKNPDYVASRMLFLLWLTPSRRMRARFSDYSVERGIIQLEEIAILDRAGDTLVWELSIHLRTIAGPPQKHRDDRRDGDMVRTWLPLSEPEIEACQITSPLFADIDPLLRCIEWSIRNEGLGSYL